MAADHVVAGCQAAVGARGDQVAGVGVGLRQVEGQGDAREHVQQVRVGGGDAGGVEEGGDGANRRGHGGAVGQVAGVVLCAAANSDVLEGEALCDCGEGGGRWRLLGCGLIEKGNIDSLSTGSTALDTSQTGELAICLPEEIFWDSKLKYSDRSSTELGLMALTLSSG